jgi:hypothetical protein
MIDSVKHRHPRNRRQSNREKRGKWGPEVDSDAYDAGKKIKATFSGGRIRLHAMASNGTNMLRSCTSPGETAKFAQETEGQETTTTLGRRYAAGSLPSSSSTLVIASA